MRHNLMGLVISQFGDNLTMELPSCLPVLVDRMGNEITRLTAVKVRVSAGNFRAVRFSIITLNNGWSWLLWESFEYEGSGFMGLRCIFCSLYSSSSLDFCRTVQSDILVLLNIFYIYLLVTLTFNAQLFILLESYRT